MRLCLFFCLISVSAFCQDTLQSVHFTPDGAARSMRSLPYYIVPSVDTQLREPSMGMSVLNTLRGQVPGLFLSPQFVTGNPSYLFPTFMTVDSAPVNSSIADLSNLNTFDYESPTVITGNATTYYGMYGGNNGVLLRSRTGEGFTRGTFSFNTFNTWGSSPNSNGNFGGDNFGQLRLSNSLAYSKDFGKVDIRASANYTYTPGFNSIASLGALQETRIKEMNVKLNTGWQISPKLRTRLIVERNSATRNTQILHYQPNPSDNFQYDHNSSRANLSFEYDALPSLRLSSRLQRSWIDNDDENYYSPYSPSQHLIHDRNLLNVFANFDKNIARNIAVSASTGIQRDKATGSFPYYINSQMNTAGIRFKDQLFVDGSFRIDNSNIDPVKNNKKTWSAATGWVFSDLLKTASRFPYGKLRASVGHYSYSTIPYYPLVALLDAQRFPEQLTDNSRQFYRYEVGTDLSFLHDRIQVTANYLRSVSTNSDPVAHSFQSGSAFVQIFVVDNTRYFFDQQQLAIGAYLDTEKTVLTRLTVTTMQTKTRLPPNHTRDVTDGQPYIIDLLQTATVEDVTLNLLLEGYSFSRNQSTWGIRQLSLSYPVAKKFARRHSVPDSAISLILRNIMGKDESQYVTNGLAKSVSVGFTMNF